MRASFRTIALFALLAAAGCVPRLGWQNWSALPERVDPALHPGAAAAMLDVDVEWLLYLAPTGVPFAQHRRHEVVQILGEPGLRYADVRIPLYNNGRLKLVRARAIGPDGAVQEVAAESLLGDEAGASAERDFDTVRFKSFRFPDVRVGSVLEYVYVVETPDWVPTRIVERPAPGVPVRRYHAEVRVSEGIRYAMQLYNQPGAKIDVRHDGDMVSLVVDAHDLPWAPEERDQPPWLLAEPFWMYRTQQYHTGAGDHHVALDWPHAMTPVGRGLYVDNGRLLDGAALERPGAGCTDKRCVLERAIAQARERAELTGFDDGWNPRPVREVVESGTATGDEKAIYLWALLDKAELHPRYAYVNRRLGELVDKAFPSPALLDHLLLYLPAQDGLPATWIDPACESCAPGELPERLSDGQAVVFWAEKDALGAPDYRAEVTNIEPAAHSAPRVARRGYDVTLAPTGDAEVAVTDELTGAAARDERTRRRGLDADGWRRDAEEFVKQRAATGHLVESGAMEFDRAAGRGRRALRFTAAGFATLDGDRLRAPLSLLLSSYDDAYLATDRTRPIYHEDPELIDERVTLHVPAGWEVAELPAHQSATSPAADYELDVRSEGGVVTARRTLSTRLGRFPTAQYPAIRSAVRAYSAAREQVIVLRRQPAPPPSAATTRTTATPAPPTP
jgi:hypothetical protein